MKYELVKIDKENNAILISADGVKLWINYIEKTDDDEKYYIWDFNQYIFVIGNSKDDEIKAAQEKIDNDIENFDCFMDDIFYTYL